MAPKFWQDWQAALDDNGLRVAQSAVAVTHMPIIVLVNALSIVIIASILSPAFPAAQRLLMVAGVWAVLAPMLRSWLRLRKRPLPQCVSRRRILSLVWYSGFMGILWSALVSFLLPGESSAVVTFVVVGIAFLCIGGTAVLSSIPLVCIAFSTPLMAAALYISISDAFNTHAALTPLLLTLILGIGWLVATGLDPIKRITALTSENAALLADLQKEVVRQQVLIAQREISREALVQSEKRFRHLAALSSDWYWEQDTEFRFTVMSRGETGPNGEILHRYLGKTRWDMPIGLCDAQWASHKRILALHLPFNDFEYPAKFADHALRWFSINGEPLFDDAGNFAGYRGTGKDITDRKNAEEQIRQLALHDPLTGLPNRALLIDRLEQAIIHADREQTSFRVLFIDLDGFKPINDRHGHSAGDQLLVTIADSLRSTLRKQDTVARLGGDEFVLVLPESADGGMTHEVLQRLLVAVARPCLFAGQELSVCCSIGVATYPHDGDSLERLLDRADSAMYSAKQAGRNTFAFYSPTVAVDQC